MLTVLGGLAEFERELIRARTGEGRARAKANGVKHGAQAEAHAAPGARGDKRRDLARSRLPRLAAATMSAAGRFRGW